MREYFCAYHSMAHATQKLSDAEFGRLFRGLFYFSETGEQPTNLNGREELLFDVFAQQIQRDVKKYEATCEKNRRNVSKRYATKPTTVNERIPQSTKSYQTYQEKEEEEGKEKEEYSPYSPSTVEEDEPIETVESYAIANLDRMTSGNLEDFASYRGDLPDELIRWAIDEAAAHGARTWAYVKRILNNLIDRNVTTVGEAKALAERREKKIPTVEDNNPALKAKFY